MRKMILAAAVGLSLPVLGLSGMTAPAKAADAKAVVTNYADIAHAMYSDALATAITLQSAIGNLTAAPSPTTMQAARAAWKAARVPYQQTEGFRFGNPIVDDWEGKVNAWPLDEGLIDYVAPAYGDASDANPYYTANVIANPNLKIGGKTIDASKITPALLSETLHELDGVEANVATGYHAIEFLLWGQDLNGTEPGAGNRPYTDYAVNNCTHGHCDRRAQYLTAAADLLVSDLQDIVAAWGPKGDARANVVGNPSNGVTTILKGLGSLSYGELAGERMRLGLMLHDPEEEHDCFSDNTQNSHYYDEVGMIAIYNGRYVRVDGSVVEGPSLADLINAKSPAAADKIAAAMAQAHERLLAVKTTADARIMAYDQMLAKGNETGNALVQSAVDALVAQAKALEGAMAPLGVASLAFEGSDSLDNPNAVFQ